MWPPSGRTLTRRLRNQPEWLSLPKAFRWKGTNVVRKARDEELYELFNQDTVDMMNICMFHAAKKEVGDSRTADAMKRLPLII
ncbi:uncharacterized protein LMH87_007590 [Akanthomyces muscarius]|uniref:Uncharacterized protein n=1 Tax=Akanthomyces muscarius TaxID=2231603 RepID=A0A9W8UNL6_AKAMU|nr:uncharacterized protein LMH87_007590 [Akanthomyces muscarius]KAJ4161558.1 hypothetical protein LMH87_007590 [Akanthomyces muscarius]